MELARTEEGGSINRRVVKMPKKRADQTRPAGRKTAYTFYQMAYLRAYKSRSKSTVRTIYNCNVTWKKMSEEDREPYMVLEQKDRDRYHRELKLWEQKNPVKKDASRHSRRKPSKPPKAKDAPKHPLSAYFWWSYDERPLMAKKNPGCNVCAISKLLGKKWKTVDSDTRLKYELMAERDKSRYRDDMEQYKILKAEEAMEKDEEEDAEEN